MPGALRDRLNVQLRKALLKLGGRLGDKSLANLRVYLSYLEAGRELSLIGEPRALEFATKSELFSFALNRIHGTTPLYLEFGVFEGESMRWWSSNLRTPAARFVGFDSFEGLPEDWVPGYGTGKFATGSPPKIEDPRVSFVVGWFDQTVPGFVPPENDQLIVNVDSDLYASAVTVLAWLEPRLRAGTLVFFDEYPDRDHEMKALAELRKRTTWQFRPLGYAWGGLHWLFEVQEPPSTS